MNSTEDDPRLAARLRSGNREAVETVVHAYLPLVLRIARGSGLTHEQAEDVTQSTFTSVIEKATSFE